ncbi:Mitochondrial import inner membrane translocase subunit tim8 [Coemansia spiralis]|nr:Mitochondrial import inner membrane translocase subunit tim8 [Coemansia spiralis]
MATFDEATQRELQEFVESETAKAKLQSNIHQFTGRCWDLCIKDAKASQLSSKESTCLQNCVGRFLDTSVQIVKQLQNHQ